MPWINTKNEAIKIIKKLRNDDQARKFWKKSKKYHTRSLVETAMYRFKRLFTGTFFSRKITGQKAELYAKSIAMNKMTRLGMPKGIWLVA